MPSHFHGGRRPIGFEVDGITVREAEASALARAAQDLVSGNTLTSVTRDVQVAMDRCRPAREPARALSREGLKSILLSARVIDSDPPIISKEEQAAVAVTLARRAKARGRRAEKSLLAGILWCGSCGHRLFVGGSAYSCPAMSSGGRRGGGSRGVGVQADPVDRLVEAEVQSHLGVSDAAWADLSVRQRAEQVRRTVAHVVVLRVGFSGGRRLDPRRIRIHLRDAPCTCTVTDGQGEPPRVMIDRAQARAYARLRANATKPTNVASKAGASKAGTRPPIIHGVKRGA